MGEKWEKSFVEWHIYDNGSLHTFCPLWFSIDGFEWESEHILWFNGDSQSNYDVSVDYDAVAGGLQTFSCNFLPKTPLNVPPDPSD